MQTLGAKLRGTREAKGITLEEVHKKTKLSINVLKVLEEDNWSSFSPIYTKGFLKIYAKFLGHDPNIFLQEYNKILLKYETTPAAIKKETSKISKVSLKLPALKLTPKIKKYLMKIILAIVLILAIIFAFRLLKNALSKIPKVPVTKKAVLTKSLSSSGKEANKTKIVLSYPKSSQEPTKQNVPVSQEEFSIVRIGLKARDDTWLQVKVDGKIMYQGTLRKGSVESWQAKNKIMLTVNNAAKIDLEFKDKLLSPLSHKKQAMKIIFTKEGMSAQ